MCVVLSKYSTKVDDPITACNELVSTDRHSAAMDSDRHTHGHLSLMKQQSGGKMTDNVMTVRWSFNDN